MPIYTKNSVFLFIQTIIKIKIHRYLDALVLEKGEVDIMSKFDRTNMKVNNPAGDLLTELETANLISDKVDSLASSGVVCTLSAECGGFFTLACC